MKLVYGLVGVAGGGYQFILGAAAGPPAATLIDNYLVLESQLNKDSDQVEQQVADAISQWQLSMGTSQSVVLSDWGKMMAVEANLANNGPMGLHPGADQLHVQRLERIRPAANLLRLLAQALQSWGLREFRHMALPPRYRTIHPGIARDCMG